MIRDRQLFSSLPAGLSMGIVAGWVGRPTGGSHSCRCRLLLAATERQTRLRFIGLTESQASAAYKSTEAAATRQLLDRILQLPAAAAAAGRWRSRALRGGSRWDVASATEQVAATLGLSRAMPVACAANLRQIYVASEEQRAAGWRWSKQTPTHAAYEWYSCCSRRSLAATATRALFAFYFAYCSASGECKLCCLLAFAFDKQQSNKHNKHKVHIKCASKMKLNFPTLLNLPNVAYRCTFI